MGVDGTSTLSGPHGCGGETGYVCTAAAAGELMTDRGLDDGDDDKFRDNASIVLLYIRICIRVVVVCFLASSVAGTTSRDDDVVHFFILEKKEN